MLILNLLTAGMGWVLWKAKKWMNNFFWSMPTPKSQPSQKVRLACVCFAAFRQDNSAGHGATFMPETESPYKSQTGGAGLWAGPLKESGEKFCRISSSRAGGINGHGPPLLGREINRGWRSRFTLQFAIWMRKVGKLARFKQGPLRYNSNHGTRLSWGAGLNSARWERAPSRYNSI